MVDMLEYRCPVGSPFSLSFGIRAFLHGSFEYVSCALGLRGRKEHGRCVMGIVVDRKKVVD